MTEMKAAVMNTYKRQSIAFVRGEGAWLFDAHGEKYLDALSGISVCSIGHTNPTVTQALREQAGALVHTSNLYRIPLQERLAEKLCDVSGMKNVFFCNSGAEANEAAIKICRRHAAGQGNKNPIIVVMEGGFHGRTLATLSATGNPKVWEGFEPLVQGFVRIPYGDAQALRHLAEVRNDIVAVMLEPVLGEGGIVIPPKGYLREVRNLCNENGWLMVLDEIQSGMARTGRWFAWQHEGTRPDIMTLAKALGNGIPIGACLAAGHCAEIFSPGNHGSTFGGNPFAARAGIAVLDYIEQHKLLDRAKILGERMLSGFKESLGMTPGVGEIRGLGLMLGIELNMECGDLVSKALQEHLLINVTAGNIIRLLPPLIISDTEAELIVQRTVASIKAFLSGG